MSTFIEKLINYWKACYPMLWVQSHEEGRLLTEIQRLLYVDNLETRPEIQQWDAADGIQIAALKTVKNTPQVTYKSVGDTAAVGKLLGYLHERISKEQCKLFVLKDFHPFLVDPVVVRKLRSLIPLMKQNKHMIVFLSPLIKIPIELEKEIQLVDFPLPTTEFLAGKLEMVKESGNRYQATKNKPLYILSEPVLDSSVESAKGLTSDEAENAFSLSLITNQGFGEKFVSTVFDEKVAQVKKSGLLTYLEPDISFDQIGGLTGLKTWLKIRGKGYSKEAKKFGLKYPKGVLLAGVPGTGKTLIAKACSKELGFPLFQLDVGSMFGKLVGETEQNFRNLTKMIDGLGRCIVLIDEVEKSLNTDAVSGKGDSGTSSRSFGSLLSWFSDHTSPVFVVATSNKFTTLPPEFIRKGRLDQLFWLDLPQKNERLEIFKVVLQKYQRNPAKFDLDALVGASDEFTGAEIDAAVNSALFVAFAAGEKDMNTAGILDQLKQTTPQAKLNSEELNALRKAAQGKLQMASDDGSITEVKERTLTL